MKIGINRVIKFLILSDLALASGFGLITPIFAIFLTTRIEGGSVETVGFAAAIYWIIESLLLIPFGHFLDKNHGEKDDLFFICFGNFLAALAVIGYLFAKYPWHIYLLYALYAVGMSMNIPGYTAIFTRHIDKQKEAISWSMRGSLVGVGSGVSGAIGGVVASRFGFNALFVCVFGFVLIGTFLPIFLWRYISDRDKEVLRTPPTKTFPSISKE